jgi:PAS domain S-box-containing protein
MFALDRAGRLTYMDPAAERLLGWRQDELWGRSMHGAIHGHHNARTRHSSQECPLWAVLADGHPIRDGQDVFIRKDDAALPVAYTAGAIVTDDGIEGVVVLFRRLRTSGADARF